MWKIVLVLAAAAAAILVGTVAWAQAPAPAVPALDVQKAQLLDPTRLVVNGTIQCQAGNTYTVSVNVTELGADASVRRSPLAEGPCATSGPQPWSVTVTGSGGSFVPVLTTFGEVTDPATRKSASNVDQRGFTLTR